MTDLKDVLNEQEKEIRIYKTILEKFPDAKQYLNRWGRKYIVANIPWNTPGIEYEFGRSCGCCSGAAFQISIFIKIENQTVYFRGYYRKFISHANDWGGIAIDSDEEVKSYFDKEVPKEIVDKAVCWISENRPEDFYKFREDDDNVEF